MKKNYWNRQDGIGYASTSISVAKGLALSLFAFLFSSFSQDRLVRETEALSPEQELAALSVPEGFRIELFATEPMINKPINLSVDTRGRVWVSSTVEYPYAATKDRWVDERGTRVRNSRDAIKILEDTDGDGRADRVTDFADRLNIPTGVVPWHKPEHHDGCIAWSIPNIWYFADTTGDGRCDQREVLFGPLGFEKDTHGMCSSFRRRDGWIYATHGFNNTSHLVAKDGSELELHSGNVFRFRPDGSHVEIWSRGQVNPFGLAFDRRGNLYSADCHSSPVYQLLRGAHYPSFGKPHDGLGFGPAMIKHSHGSTGIAGIVYLDRNVWGAEWNDRVLIGNPVNSRVNLDRIEFIGSTPRAIEQPDFVVSDDPWFRPVDLAMGPDRALYIADFYNRIIGHYEVPLEHPGRDRERGRIWRVVRERGLEDSKPTALEETGGAVVDPVGALSDVSPFRRRAGAARLQERPSLDSLPALTKALLEVEEGDSHLRHALRLALRETLRLPDAFASVAAQGIPEVASVALSVATPEAALFLFSLDEPAVSLLGDDYPALRRKHIARYAAPGVVEQLIERERDSVRSDRRAEMQVLREILEGVEERTDGARMPILYSWGAELAAELLEEHRERDTPVWRPVPHPEKPNSPMPWVLQQRKSQEGGEVTVVSSLSRGEAGAEQRTGILRSKPFPAPTELTFLLCGHRGKPGVEAHGKSFVRVVLERAEREVCKAFPPRSDVAERVSMDLEFVAGKMVRVEIVDGDSGPSYAWLAASDFAGADLPVESFRDWADQLQALQELASLLRISAPVGLRDQLQEFLPPSPPAPPRQISEQEQQLLDEVIKSRVASYDAKTTEPERGKVVFQTHCSACHRVGDAGGLIGPQLDGIGSRGLERLAEDILDPNRNVDAHFRIVAITMVDGTKTGGFVRAKRGDIIELVEATGTSQRISEADVKSLEVSPMSLMPAVFGEILTAQEFHDLIRWLESQ